MKPGTTAQRLNHDAEKQLATFVAKFEPRLQAFMRKVRRAVRGVLPTAHELVYDNYNFLVIGYSPTLCWRSPRSA